MLTVFLFFLSFYSLSNLNIGYVFSSFFLSSRQPAKAMHVDQAFRPVAERKSLAGMTRFSRIRVL